MAILTLQPLFLLRATVVSMPLLDQVINHGNPKGAQLIKAEAKSYYYTNSTCKKKGQSSRDRKKRIPRTRTQTISLFCSDLISFVFPIP